MPGKVVFRYRFVVVFKTESSGVNTFYGLQAFPAVSDQTPPQNPEEIFNFAKTQSPISNRRHMALGGLQLNVFEERPTVVPHVTLLTM
jgi:hypothetical protein